MIPAIDTASIAELAEIAARVLPANVYGYYATGARNEYTLHRNVSAWDSWEFVPRVLVDVSEIQTETAFLGIPCAPFAIAPMAAQGLAHPDAELAVARAAAAAGCLMVVSMSTNTPLETLTAVPGLNAWFQLYLFPDREHNLRIVHRAERAGAKALVVTVDVPIDVSTHRYPREGMVFPPGISFPMHEGTTAEVDSRLTWNDITWLRDQTQLPLLLKGITHPADAATAIGIGCDGIIVSNHGGRQLDGVSPTADLLPEVIEQVNGRIEVYVDGGIRRGSDILRALALDATGALVGRPVLWGLAAAGEPGVARVLSLLRTELAADAALSGVTDLRQVPRDLLRRRHYR